METFETPRLILRPRELGDFDSCLAMDSDPEVIRYVGPPWRDAEEHRAFLRQRMTATYPPGLGYWSVMPKQDPARFFGRIMLCPCTVAAGAEVEIGWRFNRSAWGKGYASEAAAPVLAQGFRNADMNEVVADIDPENRASIRVAEKLGLTFAGTVLYEDKPALRYSITDAAFRQLPTT